MDVIIRAATMYFAASARYGNTKAGKLSISQQGYPESRGLRSKIEMTVMTLVHLPMARLVSTVLRFRLSG